MHAHLKARGKGLKHLIYYQLLNYKTKLLKVKMPSYHNKKVTILHQSGVAVAGECIILLKSGENRRKLVKGRSSNWRQLCFFLRGPYHLM